MTSILDLYFRKVVGWSMSSRMTKEFVEEALHMALKNRCPGEELLHHSDRGSQYCSNDYQQVLEDHGITCSMSRKGNCWEATEVAERIARIQPEGGSRKTESFFATL